jgi:carbon-monoxide dehydrogenase medium subunit
MKPAPFDYHVPDTLEEALQIMSELGSDAAPLAGGQSLTPLMNLRLARPTNLVDMNRIDSLNSIQVEGDALKIGALVRHAQVERSEVVRDVLPMATFVAPFIGYPAIRHRGTVVGSIAHADPAAEWPCLALALDAEVVLRDSERTRSVAGEEFFQTMLTTVREPSELITEVSFNTSFSAWGFYEFARRHGDFAIIAAAAALRVTDGAVADARISLAGARDRPVRVPEVEQAVNGKELSGDLAEEAGQIAREVVQPLEDIHGSSEYRRKLIGVAIERALGDATDRGEAA